MEALHYSTRSRKLEGGDGRWILMVDEEVHTPNCINVGIWQTLPVNSSATYGRSRPQESRAAVAGFNAIFGVPAALYLVPLVIADTACRN